MRRLLAVSLVLSLPAHAVQIQAIKVSGDTSAEVSFVTDGALPAMPRLSVDQNKVELNFADVTLSPTLTQQLDISSPHALLQRISTTPGEGGNARVRLLVNGSIEKLRDRVKLVKKDGTVAVVLGYPAGSEATMKLLQEEQAGIETAKPAAEPNKGGFGWFRLLLILALFAATGVTTFYVLKVAKKKTGWAGARRHLIETVAQTGVGDGKASVAILRVGGEFVMVGVTATNVSLLSNLPQLQAQYEEESALERGSFKEAIAQTLRKSTNAGLDA